MGGDTSNPNQITQYLYIRGHTLNPNQTTQHPHMGVWGDTSNPNQTTQHPHMGGNTSSPKIPN